MATNLRLREELEVALREKSEQTGRSQQELIREALERYLGLDNPRDTSIDDLIARGVVRPARQPMRHSDHLLTLPPGVTSLDLLDREDRF